MNGGAAVQQAIANSLYGNDRLRFNNQALNQAYLAKAAQAASQLDPKQAAQLGLYTDMGPSQGYLEQYLLQIPGTVDKGQRIPGLLESNNHKLDPTKPWHWLDKKKQVEG